MVKAITWRRLCVPPRRALVISFSAIGRSALALASVVTIASAAISEQNRLASITRWCEGSLPRRGPFFGVAGMASPSRPSDALAGERQTPLVEALDHLVERLLPEVGDRQQLGGGALDQLADAVDLRPLEAVARP